MVAQLDVPLVHEDKLRRFWIDVSDVPPRHLSLDGDYLQRANG